MVAASAIPYKFATPWAADAAGANVTNPIPATATGGNASQQQGFPLITATPVASGGIPPTFADFNGFGLYLSSWLQWAQAGGPVGYDSAFSSAIGGYPQGALIRSASLGALWLSTVDNNTSDPDTGGANWIPVSTARGAQAYTAVGSYTFTFPTGVATVQYEIWGAGGGGGGSNTGGVGSGGGAGGYTAGVVSGNPGSTVSVVVGVGGAGGVGLSNGAAGTFSFFASSTATGGTGGSFGNGSIQNSFFGVGGSGSGGVVSLTGQSGSTAIPITTGFQTSVGGASYKGPNSWPTYGGGAVQGPGAVFFGVGAGGGANGGSGGTGANGAVLLTW